MTVAQMDEQNRDIRRYLQVAMSWWWLILLGPIVVGVLGFVYSKQQTPVYEASATILVEQTGTSIAQTLGDLETSRRLAGTYVSLITIRPVLEVAVEELGDSHPVCGGRGTDACVATLRRQVRASTISNSSLLLVNAKGTDPRHAALVADTVAQALIDWTRNNRLAEIARLQVAASAQGLADPQNLLEAQLNAMGSMTLVEPAMAPSSPIVPRTALNTTIGVLLGGLLAVMAAFVLEYFNDTVRSPARAESLLGLNCLGTIFRWNPKKLPARVVMPRDRPRSTYAETFRQVRANFQFALGPRAVKRAVVSSAVSREGKSTMVSNLGAALATDGVKVLLVDADMRRPSLHTFFGVPNNVGLSTLLSDPTVPLEAALWPTDVEGLALLPSGPTPPNPAELLGGPRSRSLIDELQKKADIVIYDAPPALAVADTVVLAAQVEEVLLVSNVGTRLDALRSAVEIFSRASIKPMGVILNKFKPHRLGYGYYYQYGYYHYGYHRNSLPENGHDGEADGTQRNGRKRGFVGGLRRRLQRLGRREAEAQKEE